MGALDDLEASVDLSLPCPARESSVRRRTIDTDEPPPPSNRVVRAVEEEERDEEQATVDDDDADADVSTKLETDDSETDDSDDDEESEDDAAEDDDASAALSRHAESRPRLRLAIVPRNKTLDADTLELLNEAEVDIYPEQPRIDYERPRTRADCKDGLRPCPFVSCRHHLLIDVKAPGVRGPGIKMNFPGLGPEDMFGTNDEGDVVAIPSCSLDVADGGSHNLDEVGAFMNLTRERARQIEDALLRKIRTSPKLFLFLRSEDE